MTLENRLLPINFDRKKFDAKESPLAKVNREEASDAGDFLDRAGIMGAFKEFQGHIVLGQSLMHGEIESATEKISTGESALADNPDKKTNHNLVNKRHSRASGAVRAITSIVFDWESGNRQGAIYRFQVAAIRNSLSERMLIGSIMEMDGDRQISHYVGRYYFDRGFRFSDPLEAEDKEKKIESDWVKYRKWLNIIIEGSELGLKRVSEEKKDDIIKG